MGRFRADSDDCSSVVVDVIVVEREAFETDELFVAMVALVFGGVSEDGHKGVNSAQLVVGDDHEERQQCPSDGEQVVVGWFPFEGEKGVIGLFEEAGDGVGRYCWYTAVARDYSRARGVVFQT